MTSIPQNILAEAVTRLEAVAGVQGVYRATKQGGFPILDKVIVVSHEDIERDEALSHPGSPPRIAWVLPIQVACIIIPDDDDEHPIDQRMNDFVVLAMDAITEPDRWEEFDGNCIIADLEPPIEVGIPGDDTARGVGFVVRATYRVQETSQTTLAP